MWESTWFTCIELKNPPGTWLSVSIVSPICGIINTNNNQTTNAKIRAFDDFLNKITHRDAKTKKENK